MSGDMFGRWKREFNDVLPLQNLSNTLSGWRYAPLSEDESQPHRRTWPLVLKDWVNSKAFWRTTLALAFFALVANLFRPTKDILSRFDWIDSGGSSGMELLDDPLLALDVDRSQYAYAQYVTNEAYLCNSMMIFESLRRLGARASLLMMYPENWMVANETGAGRLLVQAREYGVRLMPIAVQHFDGENIWADSFTKLLAFNQTEYKRVLSLDSDATVLQVCLDRSNHCLPSSAY